jgi:hypothetical protein
MNPFRFRLDMDTAVVAQPFAADLWIIRAFQGILAFALPGDGPQAALILP